MSSIEEWAASITVEQLDSGTPGDRLRRPLEGPAEEPARVFAARSVAGRLQVDAGA